MRSPEMSTRRISSQSRAPGRETVHVSRPEKQLLPYLSTTASSGIRSLFIFIVVLMVSVWAVAGSKHIFIVGLSFPWTLPACLLVSPDGLRAGMPYDIVTSPTESLSGPKASKNMKKRGAVDRKPKSGNELTVSFNVRYII